jgi:hypothetical protein
MAKLTIFESFVIFVVTYVIALPAIVLFVPITTIFEFFTIFHPNFFGSRNTPANHVKKVNKVQEQVLTISPVFTLYYRASASVI